MTAPTDKPTPQTACEACGRGNVSVVARPATHTKDGITVSYSDEYSVCDECGDEFYTKSQSSANSRAITTAIRQARDLPTGEEIRDARIGNLGMTLPQFEQAMCVGPNTAGRWERGTVAPGGAATGMLWVAINRPEVFLEFARSRGVVPKRDSVTVSTYSHLRENLAEIWDTIEDSREAVIVERRGHETLAILPADELASLEATAHLLRSPRNAVRLLTALQRALKGSSEAIGLDELRRELNLDAGN